MEKEVLVKVEGLSKKFCKDLKTSLWYGVKDLVSQVTGNKENETLRPKEFWALKDINFELRRGECLGLIGHNGAGKSTLLKILNGLINPDQGKVTMRGRVGALIELGAGFNPILTGRENIYNNGAVLGFTRKEIDAKVEEIIDFSEIREFIDMPVQNYSSGMKVRLGFSVAAQMEPDVLIIDEVLAVGDIGFRIKCLNRIAELLDNCAVIFVSHSMSQVAKICTQGQLLEKGMIKLKSTDIQKVVTEYFKLFGSVDSQTQGTGEVELLNVKVENFKEQINRTYVFDKSNNIDIEFDLKINNSIDYVYIGFTIVDQEQRPVALANNIIDGKPLVNNKALHHISVSIPNLLSSLTYSVTLGIFEVKSLDSPIQLGKLFLRYSDFFIIINEGVELPSYTPIQLSANWKFK